LVQEVFEQNRYPEQLYKSCDGLFRLQRTFPKEEFIKACRFALEHRVYTYTFLQNVLKNGTASSYEQKTEKSLPEHKNIRGRDYYTGAQAVLFDH
jgi:aldehyde:ferredoxin oxidoreductase